MQQGSLLPFLRDAERHVEAYFGQDVGDLMAAARATASYDLAMLAYGFRPTLSMHCAAMTAAELLYLAAQLERKGGGPPCESVAHCSSNPNPGLMRAAARQCEAVTLKASRKALEKDADALGAPLHELTQDDVGHALADFRQAATDRGVDVVMSLALELKGERMQEGSRRHHALGA
jgi:hypothetical protein